MMFHFVAKAASLATIHFARFQNLKMATTTNNSLCKLESLEKISWPSERKEDVFNNFSGHKAFVESCCFSQDGLLLATGSGDETIIIWDVKKAEKLFSLKGHEGTVWNCEFSPDTENSLICSCSSDKSVRVWNLEEKTEVASMRIHKNTVWTCRFCPGNDTTIASGSSDMIILIWDFIEDVILRTFEGHANVVEDISFSPVNGSIIASSSRDMTIRLWKEWLYPETTKCVILRGHEKRVTCCLFSPLDDGRLVSTSADMTLRFWDTDSGDALCVMEGHSNIVWGCAFILLQDCLLLVSCSSDRTLRIWDPQSGSELKRYKDLDSCLDPRAQLLSCACSRDKLAVTSFESGVYVASALEIIGDILDLCA